MPNPEQSEIAAMLEAWAGGSEEALDRLMSLLYPEFRRIARQHLGRRPGESLESAALVNELYLKLNGAGKIQCQGRTHFLALCAPMVRYLLVDHARRRRSGKRGGDALRVTLDEQLFPVEAREIEVIALDTALRALAEKDPRKSRVVELRFFGGLSLEETAGELGVSLETVKRDWKLARAWLYTQLAGKKETPG